MTENKNIILVQLRSIRATLDEHTLRFEHLEQRLAVIEHHMVALRRRIETEPR